MAVSPFQYIRAERWTMYQRTDNVLMLNVEREEEAHAGPGGNVFELRYTTVWQRRSDQGPGGVGQGTEWMAVRRVVL
jgi:hypothetical protein